MMRPTIELAGLTGFAARIFWDADTAGPLLDRAESRIGLA